LFYTNLAIQNIQNCNKLLQLTSRAPPIGKTFPLLPLKSPPLLSRGSATRQSSGRAPVPQREHSTAQYSGSQTRTLFQERTHDLPMIQQEQFWWDEHVRNLCYGAAAAATNQVANCFCQNASGLG
jgi:hypothetical protein